MPAPARAVALATDANPRDKLPAERIAEFVRDVLARSALYSWPPAVKALQEGKAPRLTRRGRMLWHLWRKEQGPIVDLRAVEVEMAAHPDLLVLATSAHAAGESENSPGEPTSGDGNMAADEANMLADEANMPAGQTKMAAGEHKMAAGSANMPVAPTAKEMPEAMTPTAFARWMGIDRRKIRQWIVEIPPGPVPQLPPGMIPARRFGHLLRILRIDFRGEPGVTPVPVIEVGGNANGDRQKATTGSAGAGAIHRSIAALRDRYSPRR